MNTATRRRALAQAVRQRGSVLAADQAKLGIVTFGYVCPLSALERMVTDAPPDCTADLEALGPAIDHL